MAASVFAYAAVLWGVLIMLFFLSKEESGLSQFNVLAWETLLPLALGSLLPVFCFEKLFCRRVGLHWLFVRLIVPIVGFILFLATFIGFFPVYIQNMFIIFPVIFFVLLQGVLLLLSVCFTAVHENIRKSWEQGEEFDFASDPKLRPIKLPPKSEQSMQQLDKPHKKPHNKLPKKSRRRDWKNNIFAAVMVAFIIGSMAAAIFWFPSYQIALKFLPAVTQAEVMSQPGDWLLGSRAAEDIPRLTGISQLEDGTYDSTTYLTVESDDLIPLSYYKLKDTSDGYARRSRRRSNRRPLSAYTDFPGVYTMYYGQYYLVELEDGNYIGAFMDSAYTSAFGKVCLPVGQAVRAGNQEAELLAEAAGTYPVPTDHMLMMHSSRNYENIKMLDLGIRFLSIAFVPAVLFCLGMLYVLKKRIQNKTH